MSAPATPPRPPIPWGTAANHLLLALMLTCTAFPVLQLAQGRLGAYIAGLAFLTALESASSSRKAADYSSLSSEWLFLRGSEFVLLTLLAKTAYYLFTPGASLLADLPRWQANLFTFFAGGFWIVAIYLLVVWAVSQSIASNLRQLEEDPVRLELERQGQLRSNRDEIRRALIAAIFILGGVMLFLVTGLNVNAALNLRVPFLPAALPNPASTAAVLLLYFLLGFGLLAQSQLAILKARWYINQVPVSPAIARRWIPYSLGLLLLLTSAAFLLPTQYAYGLFALLKSALALVLLLAGFLFALIALPFASLLNFISSLLGGSPPPNAPVSTPAPALPLPAPPAPAGLPVWLELGRSILFWAVFLGVIVLSIRFYLQQNAGMFRAARGLPLLAWLGSAWRWLRAGFGRLGGTLSASVQTGLRRAQEFILRGGKNASPVLTLSRRLPPRQQVLLVYLFLLRWNAFYGFGRAAQQTPSEYARALAGQVPALQADLETLTRLFVAARYSPRPISPAQAEEAHRALETLQSQLQAHIQAQAQAR